MTGWPHVYMYIHIYKSFDYGFKGFQTHLHICQCVLYHIKKMKKTEIFFFFF